MSGAAAGTHVARSYERWLYVALATYVAGFILFPPRVFLVNDEERYVSQAVVFAQGHVTGGTQETLVPPAPANRVASDYPPGTSLLEAPFVSAFGWRGAFAASMVALVALVLVTARWLRDTGRHPTFALLTLGFLGSLFFGRVAMSDVPTAALVALSLWALWRADQRRRGWSFLAGLAAGLTLLFREPAVVLLAPILAGALVRRRCAPVALIIGGALGVVLRLAASRVVLGSWLYVRESGYGFSVRYLPANLPVYAVILLLMFPLGAVLPFLYRGERRAELLAALGAYVTLFLLYGWNSVQENGPAKGVLLTSRFMLPVLPILALMAADVWPRAVARTGDRGARRAAWLVSPLCASVAVAAFAIHAGVHRLERIPQTIVAAIDARTSAHTPVITNDKATLKYLSVLYAPRRLILRSFVTPADVPTIFHDHGGQPMDVVFLDRYDSDMFRADARANDDFVAVAGGRCVLTSAFEDRPGPAMRLRILRLSRCQ